MKKLAALVLSGLLLSACAATAPPHSAPGTLAGDAAHPEATKNWVRTELYFGVGVISDQGEEANAAANEARWRDFLDREVTPRFPDGLSVFDVYGQWRTQGQSHVERLHSKVIMLLHADAPKQRADLDAIRAAWKKETGDLSVLRVTQPADVSF
ncbi:MAG: DUF3574 domain-containing protein [Proteobacteria bacterium]|uniref:DUF3574 domain-containing protein n=1 Tax=Rudaea sp. TaxID=2136325 RepID=UPI003220358A|nr:DUF3574 domain-containing protein [Pseudomonadota bacterium]